MARIFISTSLSGNSTMQIALDLTDERLQHFNPNQLPLEILEALAVQAYQAAKITRAEVGRILGLPSRWAVDAFLKEHNAYLHYDEADLADDRETLRQLRTEATGDN